MIPPTGRDTLPSREAYLHRRQAWTLARCSVLVVWLLGGTAVAGFVLLGMAGFVQ